MMTVRFPSGQAVQYNNANFLKHCDDATWILSEIENGKKIAFIQASAGVIVEFVHPCEVYNPLHDNQQAKIDELTKEIKSLKRKVVGKK